jgi:hypothetical protein
MNNVVAERVRKILADIESLLSQIVSLRRQVNEIEAGLAETKRDYDKKLAQVNAEADKLESLKHSLLARSKSIPIPAPPLHDGVIPPPQGIEAKTEQPTEIQPLPLRESDTARRKRRLLDHIDYFTDEGQADVIGRIHAFAKDERRGVGDILELLKWGSIWQARPDWETLEEQEDRLKGWRGILQERLDYWQRELQRISQDQRHSLWQRKKALSGDEWQSFLQQLAKQQEWDNEQLRRKVAELEHLRQAQQTESGNHHA